MSFGLKLLEVLKPISGGIAKSEAGHIENTGIQIMQFVHLLHRQDSGDHLRSPVFACSVISAVIALI